MRVMQFADVESVIFQKAQGLNTWRKGDKWADLKLGEIIRASDLKDDTLSFLKVHGVINGRAGALLPYHALSNHGVRCIEITDQDEAEDHLGGILEQVYDTPLEPDDNYTVIYLEHYKSV